MAEKEDTEDIARKDSESKDSMTDTLASNASSTSDLADFDINVRVQMHGVLMKQPFGNSSKKWQKRFFIIKEGFLLYYGDTEAKKYNKTKIFNTHPKGVVPLGGCVVSGCSYPTQKYAVKVAHNDFKGVLVLAAQSEEEKSEWLKVLQDSGKVTWNNAQLGEKVIQNLEGRGAELAQEKQEYIDKLRSEAEALKEEKGKKQELQALAAKLEGEKAMIETAAKDLRQEKDSTEQELQSALDNMRKIEEDKAGLEKLSQNLQADLQTVSEEKSQKEIELQQTKEESAALAEAKNRAEETVEELKQQAEVLDAEKTKLESSTSLLQGDIEALAEQQTKLEEEKLKSIKILEEREQEMQSLVEEKNKAASKLDIERKKRQKAEKRLRLAEDSLKRLDRALKESGVKIDLEIEIDVRNLRDFFEECIEEERFASEKLQVMKEALSAKVDYNKSTSDLQMGSPPPDSDISTPTNGMEDNTPTDTPTDHQLSNGVAVTVDAVDS